MRWIACIAGCGIALAPPVALAGFQISVYGGGNTATDSDVDIRSPSLTGSFDVDWFGDSFNPPPYYGIRGTLWLDQFQLPQLGLAVDFTHAKVKADLGDPALAPFDRLEFTNGLNSLTFNVLYRMPLAERFSVYAGAGAGASIPHVEVKTISSNRRTNEYQVTGPLAQGLIGTSFDIGHGFSLFGEYTASYSWNKADLKGGGTLETNLLAHHFAVGLSYAFGATK